MKSVAFSPDGKLLASGGGGSDRTLRLWDVTRQRLVGTPIDANPGLTAVAFSPDGKLLASGGKDSTMLWDVATRHAVGDPIILSDGVGSLAFSPDGRLLALGRRRAGTVRLLDVATRQLLGDTLKGPSADVTSVAFSPDGKLLASASSNGAVRLWNIDPDNWAERLCNIANRNLTLGEWQHFIGPTVPYRRTCPNLPAGAGAPSR